MRELSTNLTKRIVKRCDVDKLPHDHELRRLAKAFDEAAVGFYATPQSVDVKQFMGHWARLRRRWCEYSGESLI